MSGSASIVWTLPFTSRLIRAMGACLPEMALASGGAFAPTADHGLLSRKFGLFQVQRLVQALDDWNTRRRGKRGHTDHSFVRRIDASGVNPRPRGLAPRQRCPQARLGLLCRSPRGGPPAENAHRDRDARAGSCAIA